MRHCFRTAGQYSVPPSTLAKAQDSGFSEAIPPEFLRAEPSPGTIRLLPEKYPYYVYADITSPYCGIWVGVASLDGEVLPM
jgi:hypothetical protein